MKKYMVVGILAALMAFSVTAHAVPWSLTKDYLSSGGYADGDATERTFEIWQLGSKIEGGQLKFTILQDLPKGGANAPDSYAPNPLLSPGDLWIRIGTRDPFASGYPLYAVALTTHDNVAQQKYPGEVWPMVTEGRLYTNAVFSTGTFETYQQVVKPKKWWLTPDDQDGNDAQNSYLALIKGFDQEIIGHSSVTWGPPEPYWFQDPKTGVWVLVDSWRITGYVDLDQLGLWSGMNYALFLSSECGNDGAQNGPYVPEPSLPLLGGALLGLKLLRRRRA